MELTKIPPSDIEAEQAVLGSMLTDKDAVISAIEVLKPEDFYREDNKAIYEAILSLYNRAEPVDIITLKSELATQGKLEQVGGLEYLAELPEKVPTTANVEKYIKIVEEKAILRNLIKTVSAVLLNCALLVLIRYYIIICQAIGSDFPNRKPNVFFEYGW